MLRFRPARAPALFTATMLTALLTACGGGGGGGSGGGATPAASPALTFNPSTVSATLTSGVSSTLNVVATVVRPSDFSGASTVYATVTDTTGAILPTSTVVRDSDTQYHAVLQTAPTLSVGSHAGNFSVALCRDSACASQFPGSPMQLPYSLTVTTAGAATFNATTAAPLTATAHLGGSAPASVVVSIAATGRSWTAGSGASWLTLSAASGSGDASITASYNLTGLAIGSYSTAVTVTSNDGQTVSLPVSLTVEASGLVLGSDSVTFAAINGAPIPSQIVSLDTDNKVGTSFTVASNATWLTASPTSGTTPATTILTVDPSVAKLAAGSYTGTLTVTPSGLTARNLPVTLNLTAATLLPSSNSLTLGGTYGRDFSTTQPLSLSLNTSTVSWPWTMSNLPAWATATVSAGTINASGASTVFTAKPASATVGITSQLLKFSAVANGDTDTASVLLTINKDAHKLLPSATGVAFTSVPGWTTLTKTLTVTDNYGTFAGMSAVSDSTWLVAGVTASSLTLTADPTQLLDDTLTIGTITLTASDPDATAVETIRVGLWKGSATPGANVTVPLLYTTVVSDPIRPYAYLHNGGAYIDVYNLYTGAKVASMTGFSAHLGDMVTSMNGRYLYVLDIDNSRITIVDLTTQAISSQLTLASAGSTATRLKMIRPNGVETLVMSDGTAYMTLTNGKLASLPLSSGTLAASANGKLVVQQDEGSGNVLQTSVAVDYAALNGGTLYSAKLPVASHAGPGTLGQDVALNSAGTLIYSASTTPKLCSVMSATDLGVLSYLAIGDATPNNVEVDVDGRVYCGGAAKPAGNDIWVYNTSGTLLFQFKLSSTGAQLLPRQMAVSSDGRMLIGITTDSAATIVPVGP